MELALYLYQENGYTSSELFSFFKSLGYKFYEVSSTKRLISFKNFQIKYQWVQVKIYF